VKTVVSLLLALVFLGAPASAQEITFLYMKQSGYDLSDIVARADSFQRETGTRARPIFVEYKDRYTLITAAAAKTVPDYDLILLDLIWTADFAAHGIIDPLPPRLARSVTSGIVPGIYGPFEYRGKLWALPFHVDFQLLYTNLDLLARAGYARPPRTLEELEWMGAEAKRRGVLLYPLFDSWNEQEVLVCEFTWLVGAFGGKLTGSGGQVSCTTPACLAAVRFMARLLDEGVVNPYSLQSDEDFAAEVFQAGDCLFTTNWSFLIRLLGGPESGFRWALSPIPVSQRLAGTGVTTSSVSGFEGLSVMARSAHKVEAWSFAAYLDSPEFQGAHLEFMPVWKEVWARPATIANDPFLGIKQQQIAGLQYRPVHPLYGRISAALQKWLFKALQGQAAPEKALAEAQREIDAVVKEGP
jgi:multiple sugar transport system substrate-binding protein